MTPTRSRSKAPAKASARALPALSVIPAGAGSGKTYHIQHQLGEWIASGRVAPERIVAVTFTEAAAAELRERISANLLTSGQTEAALRLDQAYISTIHAFGLRILSEFAFEAGTSPRPRQLSEDEQSALLRRALPRTDKADVLIANLARYGYKYDYNSKQGPEDRFRDDLLRVIELLRALGWQGADDRYAEASCQWIAQLQGTATGKRKRAETLEKALRQRVESLLKSFPDSLEREHGKSKAAIGAFQSDFKNLRRARDTDALGHDWDLWQALRDLRQSKRGNPLPEEYNRLSTAVMDAANALLSHPGPLEQAQTHIRALLAAGQDILAHYAQAKREAGLVDYSDMVALAAALLRASPTVRDTLVGRIDCLVVDEFQDTNPTQFALLWQLRQAGVPTIVVGDLKQAIMGFQGADARLFEAIIAQQGSKAKPLTKNWRSQPALVDFVNALGPGLFPGAYQALAPQRKTTVKQPLELMVFAKRAKSGKHSVRAYSLGQRLRTLLTAKARPLTDRHTGQRRPLRGGDIAVLCPTHGMLGAYAEELRRQGLRVRQAAHGWLDSRPIQLMWYALAFVANPDDRHAALYLAVTELGGLSLQDALEQLMQDGRIDDPILEKLDAITAQAQVLPVDAVVAATIRALGLFDQVMRWPEAEQARANLVRLQAEAVTFTDTHPDARAQAGLFGAGLPSFLAWLATQVEGRDGDRQPDPRVIDEDAIVLSTWHAAKGREWPLVCVCGLEYSIKASVPNLGLGYPRFDDLARVLDEARIEYAPAFAAPESNEPFLQLLQAAQETSARRLLYVALTRARDKLILEWPAFQDDKDSSTYYRILRQEGGASLDAKGLKVGKKHLPCLITAGTDRMPDDSDDADEQEPTPLPLIGRRAIRRGTPPPALTQDSLTPSQMGAVAAAADTSRLELHRYGSGLTVTVGLSGLERGTFIHRCFEVLGARPALAGQGRDRLTKITGVAIEPKEFALIAAAVNAFETWLRKTFQPAAIKREWPVAALNAQGSLVTGTADLIVETNHGCWIIDHKSDQTDDPLAGFALYRPQLQAYADALSAAGSQVLGVAVHWTRRGEVVLERC